MKHIVVVIDRSGSMQMIRDDMNGAMQEWLKGVKKEDETALITSVLFDDRYEVTNSRAYAKDIEFDSLKIVPRGTTALYDALFKALANVEEDALVFVVTDGQENASREVTREMLTERITKLQDRGVQFQYLSASADAFQDAGAIGIDHAFTQQYTHNAEGTRTVAYAMTTSSVSYLSDTKDGE